MANAVESLREKLADAEARIAEAEARADAAEARVQELEAEKGKNLEHLRKLLDSFSELTSETEEMVVTLVKI